MFAFERKALDHFGEVVVRKDLVRGAGFGARAIPTYVAEWILSDYISDGQLTDESRSEVAGFLERYLPQKGQKEQVKHRLVNMEVVRLLDDYSVTVNLKTGARQLRIPLLDIDNAFVSPQIVEENDLLLTSGVWGIGELFYVPPDDSGGKGQVWMREFEPFQIASIDMEYYAEARRHFALDEWIDLLVSSMGFNPGIHDTRQKSLLLARVLAAVEPRLNIAELAPKGTGKSFVYDNLSRYVRSLGGGKVTPAVLFHNNARHTPGLITRYDAVVFDEVQSVQDDSSGELIAGLKTYLESGRYSRGNTTGAAEAGLVMLGNILLDDRRLPLHAEDGIFNEFPNFLRETAFIDRLHGLIPGWELPRVTCMTPSISIGFKGDFFSEVLHHLRADVRFVDFVKQHTRLTGCDDLRDAKAIERLATGYVKLLFPDLRCSAGEFNEHCLALAVEMRQRIREELHRMEPEYERVIIRIVNFDLAQPTTTAAPEVSAELLDPQAAAEEQLLSKVASQGSDALVRDIQDQIAPLKHSLPDFAAHLDTALRDRAHKPQAALVAIRRALEQLLGQVAQARIGGFNGRPTLYEMISQLDDAGALPETTKSHLHSIRALGNIGAHEADAALRPGDVDISLLAALGVGHWVASEGVIRSAAGGASDHI